MKTPFDPDDSIHIPSTAPVHDAAADETPSAPAIPGYEIARKLGGGGQGVVYLAMQKSTTQLVAIKMLREDRPISEAADRRFQQEARVLAQLRHPNIVVIHDSGTSPGGRRYYVMEYVHGQPLHEHVPARKLTATSMIELFMSICGAVEAAHAKGIVHHDLKPSNILVEKDGIAKLLDFGLARVLSSTVEFVDHPSGMLPGTLAYMSPEQTQGDAEDIDARSDVYALGVILYELLTGCHPYPAFPVVERSEATKHIRETVPIPPSRAWTSESGIRGDSRRSGAAPWCPILDDLDAIVLKALAKDRDRRYRDAGELCRDLESWRRDEPLPSRRGDFGYLLKKRTRRIVGNNAVIIHGFLALLVYALVWYVAAPMADRWTGFKDSYEKLAKALAPSNAGDEGFQNVAVIALHDETNPEALAQAEAIDGVDSSVLRSLRRLHGRLMEKLATSGCRAVVWDFHFAGDSEFDARFVQGIERLREAGIDVVVGVHDFLLDDPASHDLSQAITSSDVRLGCTAAALDPNLLWAVPLVGQRGLGVAFPSLAMIAYTSARHADTDARLVLRIEDASVDVLYTKYNPTLPADERWLVEPDHVRLNWAEKLYGHDAAALLPFGIRPGDAVGITPVEVRDDSFLLGSTKWYEDVFSADTSTLRKWFGQRVVVIGDARSTASDRFDHPDGRKKVPGCYAHATAIDQLLTNSKRLLDEVRGEWPLAVAIALGTLVGWTGRPRFKTRATIAVSLSVFAIGASLFFAWKYGYLCNPLIPIVALWIASECSAAVEHVARPRL